MAWLRILKVKVPNLVDSSNFQHCIRYITTQKKWNDQMFTISDTADKIGRSQKYFSYNCFSLLVLLN